MLAAVERPDRAADAERAFQKPRHAAHDRRQHPPVEQQRGQHAHHQDDRQRLKRQDEIRTGRLEIEGQRAAAEIAEHEGGAGAGRGRNGVDGVVDGAEGAGHQRQLDQHQRGDERDRKSDRRLPPRHRAAVFAERPRHRQQRQHAERRLQLQHDPKAPSGDYDSGGLASAMPGSPSAAAIDKAAGVGHGVTNNNCSGAANGSRFEKQETGLPMSTLMPVGAGALLRHPLVSVVSAVAKLLALLQPDRGRRHRLAGL